MSKYLHIKHRPHVNLGSRTDVKILTYTSTGLFRGKQTLEQGRLQIWNPKRLERPRPNNSQGGDFSKHRNSVATGSSSYAPSMARSFATSYTSEAISETTTAFNFEMPSLPILVFYLRADEPGNEKMGLLSIERKFCLVDVQKSQG